MTPSPPIGRRRLTAATSLVLVVAPLLALASVATPAGAQPADDLRAEAAARQDEIEANGRRIGELAEQFNGAQLRLEQAQATIDAAQARIDAARAEVERIEHLVAVRAASVYRSAATGRSLDEIAYDDAQDLLSRRHYASKQAGHDDELLAELERAQDALAAEKATAEAARTQALAEQEQIEAARREVEAANSEQQRLLDGISGELAALVEEEEQRRDAENAAVAQTLYTGGGGAPAPAPPPPGDGGGNPSPPPAPGAAAGIAIDFAYAQLGKPYVYAASGPDAYDCSGLTMAAYRAAGVSLPHYSGAQYSMLPKVPLNAMQPGDLVFWGPGGSSHVGLYIGNGLMIHAPHTGDVVKIAGIYGSPVGAARPG